MAKKLTRTTKKQITKEWNELFPSMGVYKNMWLMNILGPLAVGILLEVKSDNTRYIPMFHVHDLTKETENVTLNLSITDNLQDVSARSKETKYLIISEHLKSKAIVPYKGDVRLNELILGIKNFINNSEIESEIYYGCEMLKSIALWSNKLSVQDEINGFIMEKIRLNVFSGRIKEKAFSLLEKIEECDTLNKTIEQQIIRLKLEKLPRREIIID